VAPDLHLLSSISNDCTAPPLTFRDITDIKRSSFQPLHERRLAMAATAEVVLEDLSAWTEPSARTPLMMEDTDAPPRQVAIQGRHDPRPLLFASLICTFSLTVGFNFLCLGGSLSPLGDTLLSRPLVPESSHFSQMTR
jgi:hypothetical protein